MEESFESEFVSQGRPKRKDGKKWNELLGWRPVGTKENMVSYRSRREQEERSEGAYHEL